MGFWWGSRAARLRRRPRPRFRGRAARDRVLSRRRDRRRGLRVQPTRVRARPIPVPRWNPPWRLLPAVLKRQERGASPLDLVQEVGQPRDLAACPLQTLSARPRLRLPGSPTVAQARVESPRDPTRRSRLAPQLPLSRATRIRGATVMSRRTRAWMVPWARPLRAVALSLDHHPQSQPPMRQAAMTRALRRPVPGSILPLPQDHPTKGHRLRQALLPNRLLLLTVNSDVQTASSTR